MRDRLSHRTLLGIAAALRWPRGYSQTSETVFEEVPPATSGVTWVHNNAVSAAHHPPETLGPGCAFLDFDNDGRMDLFLVNSGPCDFYKSAKPLGHALYKNNRDGTFSDVTAKAGLGNNTTFGMGVAAGDFNRIRRLCPVSQ